jgi:hypothetical protein
MATTSPSVSLRFGELDKANLVELAERLQMNKTQLVRVLVRETLLILKEQGEIVSIPVALQAPRVTAVTTGEEN